MKKNPFLSQIYITVFYILLVIYGFFITEGMAANNFFNSNLFFATITFFVGSFALYVYTKQKIDSKKDAAKIIIQEIRRAEDIIADYKHTKSYEFAKKIIAVNSWTKNIHYFVNDFENDELDKISNLYSTGEYLDNQIQLISTITFNDSLEILKSQREAFLKKQLHRQEVNSSPISPAEQSIMLEEVSKLSFQMMPPVWQARLEDISNKVELIYLTNIVLKLRKIAGLE